MFLIKFSILIFTITLMKIFKLFTPGMIFNLLNFSQENNIDLKNINLNNF